MIETKTVDRLPTLGRKVEMPSPVCFRRAKHRATILGAICDGHVWDWSAARIKHNTFDFLSKLRLVDDNEFPDGQRRKDEEGTHKRDGHHAIHCSIIDLGGTRSKHSDS